MSPSFRVRLSPHYLLSAFLLLGASLQGCSQGSGKQGAEYPAPPGTGDGGVGVVYNGPSPSTDDVQNFKREFWDNIASEERCGACHVEGNQSPFFARRDDINLAYTAANGVVNLADPGSSEIVDKVSSGHGCWSENSGFCAEKIAEWVTNWASESGVELTDTGWVAPELFEVSASLTFPESSDAFATHVHPLLRTYCAECHRADAPQAPVQPYLAASDVDTAYLAAQTKMLFNTTSTDNGYTIDASRSRLVQRLREESHNCWENNCDSSADEMQVALEAFAATMEMREPDGTLVASKAMRIGDGMAISQGGRVETNAIALYSFKAGRGSTVSDYADGFPPALDLTLNGGVEWVSNWGVRINSGRVQGAVSASRKLHRYISQTGEYSIEAWVVPANVSQDGPARIVSYSGNNAERNFTLGQTLYNYNFFNRSSESDADGRPLLSTPDAQEVLQATLQHVVASYDAIQGRRIYVNGQLIDVEDPLPPGNLNGWDDNFVLVLGNETSGEYPWQGTIRLLAIHNRALTPEQVQINYDVGVGQKIRLAFSVAHLIDGMDDAYVVFEVEQFDDYSYLFKEPYFYSDTEEELPQDLRIQGMRIGVNGREANVGQVFAKVDTTIEAAEYARQENIRLSRLGAVIQLEQGPELDQFFLTFDRIGNHQFVRTVESPPPAPTPEDKAPQPRVGVRTFAEINASLASMTGVPVTHDGVRDTYEKVQQQMPVDENVKGFLVAHQMGITQLAVKYCNVLATDADRRQAFFPEFDGQTFDTAGRSAVIDPLLKALVAHSVDGEGSLQDQPLPEDSQQRLNDLIDTMTLSCGGGVCGSAVMENTLTATCAAALGSAIMLVQ